jgi:hypothetical protein
MNADHLLELSKYPIVSFRVSPQIYSQLEKISSFYTTAFYSCSMSRIVQRYIFDGITKDMENPRIREILT